MAHASPILIVGAGPVGMLLALILGQQGINCRIIDKLEKKEGYCKALGIQPKTLEVFEDLGIINEIIPYGLWFKSIRLFKSGKEISKTEIQLNELPYGFLSIPQFKLEAILLQILQKHGIEPELGVELIDFAQEENGVLVNLLHHPNEQKEQVYCDYLIGCDGAHSLVRKLLGLKFEGDRLAQHFMLADVKVDWPYDYESTYRFSYLEQEEENTLIFVPYRDKKRFRISTTVPEHILDKITDQEPTIGLFQSLVKQAVPAQTTLSDLRWSSVYRISHRIVDRYSDKRVFVAGDAAHIHPPVGGQGMNTGFQDAYNLGWKLAMVLKKQASSELLTTYHEERYPVGLEVVHRTHQRLLEAQKDKLDIAQQAFLQDSQVLINYRNSSLTKPMPKAVLIQSGDRADDVCGLRMKGFNFELRLFQLLQKCTFKLLVYIDQEPGTDLLDSLEELEKRYTFLQCLVIAKDSLHKPDTCLLTWINDSQQEFSKKWAAKTNLMWLIRPDNYLQNITDSLESIESSLHF